MENKKKWSEVTFFCLLQWSLRISSGECCWYRHGRNKNAPLWLHFKLQPKMRFFFLTTRIQQQSLPFFLIYMIFLPTHLFVWTSAWKNVKHLKMLLREEKKSMYVTFTWQPSKVVKAIRTRRPLVCLAVICSWSPRLPTTPWVSCIMQQQFWLKSKNLLTECSVGHLGRCLINYYNWHPHQMSDIWQSLCW